MTRGAICMFLRASIACTGMSPLLAEATLIIFAHGNTHTLIKLLIYTEAFATKSERLFLLSYTSGMPHFPSFQKTKDEGLILDSGVTRWAGDHTGQTSLESLEGKWHPLSSLLGTWVYPCQPARLWHREVVQQLKFCWAMGKLSAFYQTRPALLFLLIMALWDTKWLMWYLPWNFSFLLLLYCFKTTIAKCCLYHTFVKPQHFPTALREKKEPRWKT